MEPGRHPDNRVARAFRHIVSGDPDGRPEWVRAMEEGDDAGLFGPGSAPWAVHGHLATLVGGIRALLLQALHPAALAGVMDHSRYRDDPLARLAGTTRWLVTVTFGDSLAVERESARVRRMHRRVRGSWLNPDDPNALYSADDPALLRWVHVAFTDSFLATHLVWGKDIPGGPDRYVADWGQSAVPLGLLDPPTSRTALALALQAFEPDLRGGDRAREIADFVMHPPLPRATRPAYALLAAGAVSTLSPRHRAMLGLHSVPQRPTRLGVRAVLAGMALALGPMSPSERAARTRLARLNWQDNQDGPPEAAPRSSTSPR